MFTWFITPFIIEYIGAGDFSKKEKIMRSLRANVPFYVIYFVIFIIVVIVLAFTDSGQQALKK